MCRWQIRCDRIEPQFYALLLEKTGAAEKLSDQQMDRSKWPEMRETLRDIFRTRTRDEWCEIMEGTDVCFAPVLALEEVPNHPHQVARGVFVDVGGVRQVAPAPRFSGTPATVQWAPSDKQWLAEDILSEWT